MQITFQSIASCAAIYSARCLHLCASMNDCRRHSVDRRQFVRAAFVSVATFLLRPGSASARESTPALTIAFAGPSSGASREGFDLGLYEVERSARLFGKTVSGGTPSIPFSFSGDSIASTLSKQRATVVVGALADEETRSLANACIESGIVFINARSRSDDLRRSLCTPLVYHIEASEAMYSSARKMAQAPGDAGPPQAAPEIVLWHPALERYGASQLNDRFRAAARTGMTGPAWAAWMATKVVSEAYFRTGDPSAKSIAAWLSRESAQFDGHKGAPLSFRPWDHQLRQPLYSVAGLVVKDIPDLGRSSEPARSLLDQLGDPEQASHCKVSVK